MKFLIFLAALLTIIPSKEVLAQIKNEPKDTPHINKTELKIIKLKNELKEGNQEIHESNNINLDEDQLIADSDLLTRALLSSIILQDIEAINTLLPIYEKINATDEIVILNAKALQNTNNKNYKEAIKIYETIIQKEKHSARSNFNLALNYAYDYKNIEAINLLNSIKYEFELNNEEIELINDALDQIHERDKLSVGSSFSFTRDRNINGITDTGEISIMSGTLTTPPRESGNGLKFNFFGSKKTSIKNGKYLIYGFDFDGKLFIDNKKYNDVTSRIYTGIGRRNHSTEVAVKPFLEKRWFGNKPYSEKYGLSTYQSYIINEKSQLINNLEIGRKTHQHDRSYLNGNSYSASTSAIILPTDRTYAIIGLFGNKEYAQDKSDQYTSKTISLGIGNNITENISIFTSASFNKKNYAAPFAFFEKRKDYNPYYTFSISDKSISFNGFTPKITFSHNRKRSNNPLFNYITNDIYLSVDKYF